MALYNKVLSDAESLQNYEYFSRPI
jgi:hypothetical protein